VKKCILTKFYAVQLILRSLISVTPGV